MSQSSRWLSVLESLFVLSLFFFHVSIEPVTSYSIRTSVTTTTTTTTSPATTQHTTPTLSTLSMTAITGPSSNSNNNNNNSNNNNMKDRRSLLMSFVSVLALNMGGSVAVAAALPIETTLSPTTTSTSSSSSSSSNLPLESVYFGVGCFWHIQHEFVTAERDLLGRSDRELTSSTGYAGGLAADKMGRVCYHNLQGVADYGKLGHGEVVGMQLPTNKIVDFSSEYFSLYNPKTLGRCR
jgi:hypothetical protein